MKNKKVLITSDGKLYIPASGVVDDFMVKIRASMITGKKVNVMELARVVDVKIGYISDGIVIDHIPPEKYNSLYKMLSEKGIEKEYTLSIGINYSTKKKHLDGKKCIIKIETKEPLSLVDELLDSLAEYEGVTISIIEEASVKSKFKVRGSDLHMC